MVLVVTCSIHHSRDSVVLAMKTGVLGTQHPELVFL